MQNPISSPPPPSSSSSFSSTFFNLRDPKPKPTLILLYTFLFLSLLSLTLILTLSHSTISTHSGPDPFLHPTHTHRLVFDPHKPSPPPPPAVAYLISGSRGDAARVLRLLHAAYHPLNIYLLHLDPAAPHAEREHLAVTVQSHPIFKAAQNVHVVGKPDFSYTKGSSPVSLRLHAASVLLRLSRDWDWFVSLSADAYPLVTQDGMSCE